MSCRTTRSALAAALVVVLLAVTGCATTVTGVPAPDPAPAPTEGPGSDPVAWVDRICGGVLAFAVPVAAAPDFRAAGDLPALKKTFSTYLGSVVTGIEQARTQLDAAGRSPVPGGDEVADRARAAMKKLETDFAAALAAVNSADPRNPDAFVAALAKAQTTLAAIVAPDALAGIVALPRLGPAAQRSAQCQKLSAMAAPR